MRSADRGTSHPGFRKDAPDLQRGSNASGGSLSDIWRALDEIERQLYRADVAEIVDSQSPPRHRELQERPYRRPDQLTHTSRESQVSPAAARRASPIGEYGREPSAVAWFSKAPRRRIDTHSPAPHETWQPESWQSADDRSGLGYAHHDLGGADHPELERVSSGLKETNEGLFETAASGLDAPPARDGDGCIPAGSRDAASLAAGIAFQRRDPSFAKWLLELRRLRRGMRLERR